MLKKIFVVILSCTLSFGVFIYQFCLPISASESSWKIITGQNKVTSFEFLSWFSRDVRLYSLAQNKNELIFAPSSPFYVFSWSPPGKTEGRYVWQLRLNPLSLKSILYESFIALKPQLPGELPKRMNNFLQHQVDYEVAKNTTSREMLLEVIRLSTINKQYEAKLWVSDFKRITRRRLGTEFVNNEPQGWHTGVYYSGNLNFEIFVLSESKRPIIIMKKRFKDWDYPLRRNDHKSVQPSFIGALCKLYMLPDSRPIFMIFSKVYKGMYQPRQGIDDAKFSVIIP